MGAAAPVAGYGMEAAAGQVTGDAGEPVVGKAGAREVRHAVRAVEIRGAPDARVPGARVQAAVLLPVEGSTRRGARCPVGFRARAPRVRVSMNEPVRCWWCGDDPLYVRYHDEEWGRPVEDDRRLFEKICLEGFQAGLSWLTILRKRDDFRRAFRDFEPQRVSRFTARDVERLLADARIVRHRGKIESVINNAKRARELQREEGSLATYFWKWRPDDSSRPRIVTKQALMRMSTTPASVALSKDLRKRGWTFVGPTTIYAFMQAMGVVNDHVHDCYVRALIPGRAAS
jgi:DNA-3-methyladenine glycosylase I